MCQNDSWVSTDGDGDGDGVGHRDRVGGGDGDGIEDGDGVGDGDGLGMEVGLGTRMVMAMVNVVVMELGIGMVMVMELGMGMEMAMELGMAMMIVLTKNCLFAEVSYAFWKSWSGSDLYEFKGAANMVYELDISYSKCIAFGCVAFQHVQTVQGRGRVLGVLKDDSSVMVMIDGQSEPVAMKMDDILFNGDGDGDGDGLIDVYASHTEIRDAAVQWNLMKFVNVATDMNVWSLQVDAALVRALNTLSNRLYVP